MNTNPKNEVKNKRPMATMEIVGIVLVILSMFGLFAAPQHISGAFNSMVARAHPVVINTGILSTMSVSIILSVMMGRILERLGFTDALMRIFLPFAKLINVNAAILIPSIYNILGDINASGKIAGPILQQSGATKDEKKIAIFTMIQSQQSFSTFMIGLGCLTLAGINAFAIVVIALFLPLLIWPTILRYTIWRDCKTVELEDLPVFTPNTPFLNTVFTAGQEGANILFLLILPAFAVVFGFIGLLDYVGIWAHVQVALEALLTTLNIDPATGASSILVSPTLAMTQLTETAAQLDPRWVIGSFVLGASGFPLSVIFGQIPIIWSSATDLKPSEAMWAAVLGGIARLFTAGLVATILTRFLI